MFAQLAVMQTAPSSSAQILELLQVAPSVIQMGSENLKVLFQILECYLLLDLPGLLKTNFDPIIAACTSLFDDFGDECLILLVKFVNSFLTSAVANEISDLPASMVNLIGSIFAHFNTQPGPVLRSAMYLVAARVMLQFKHVFSLLLPKLNLNLTLFIKQWCSDMDSITHSDRRKLSAFTIIGESEIFT